MTRYNRTEERPSAYKKIFFCHFFVIRMDIWEITIVYIVVRMRNTCIKLLKSVQETRLNQIFWVIELFLFLTLYQKNVLILNSPVQDIQ